MMEHPSYRPKIFFSNGPWKGMEETFPAPLNPKVVYGGRINKDYLMTPVMDQPMNHGRRGIYMCHIVKERIKIISSKHFLVLLPQAPAAPTIHPACRIYVALNTRENVSHPHAIHQSPQYFHHLYQFTSNNQPIHPSATSHQNTNSSTVLSSPFLSQHLAVFGPIHHISIFPSQSLAFVDFWEPSSAREAVLYAKQNPDFWNCDIGFGEDLNSSNSAPLQIAPPTPSQSNLSISQDLSQQSTNSQNNYPLNGSINTPSNASLLTPPMTSTTAGPLTVLTPAYPPISTTSPFTPFYQQNKYDFNNGSSSNNKSSFPRSNLTNSQTSAQNSSHLMSLVPISTSISSCNSTPNSETSYYTDNNPHSHLSPTFNNKLNKTFAISKSSCNNTSPRNATSPLTQPIYPSNNFSVSNKGEQNNNINVKTITSPSLLSPFNSQDWDESN